MCKVKREGGRWTWREVVREGREAGRARLSRPTKGVACGNGWVSGAGVATMHEFAVLFSFT